MAQLQLDFKESTNQESMVIEYVNISELKESNDASRVEIGRMLDESLKYFGFQLPILINKNNVIICGVNRVRAAKRVGMEKIPCVRTTLDDQKQEEYRLVDNKTGEECSNWDWCGLTKALMKVGDLPKFDLIVKKYHNGYVERFFLNKKQPKLNLEG